MRERIFKGILTYLENHPSKMFEQIQIQILLMATAKAFGRKGKCILFSKDALKDYAVFTQECMKTSGDRRRIYRVSYQLGRQIRHVTGFTNRDELQRLVFLLYRNIGITMTGEIPGEIIVSECFFSNVYSSKECRYISAMDAGIVTGICGKGKLAFTERLTEGCGHCRACVTGRRSV